MSKKQTKHHGSYPLAGQMRFCNRAHDGTAPENRFGRLFTDLGSAFQPRSVLREASKRGGPMDAGSKKDRTDTVDVGQIFFGQFVDHDITFDVSSSFSSVAEPQEIRNARTPQLDLDCIYGQGPEAMPFLYHQSGDFAGIKLLTGADEPSDAAGLAQHDLLRVALAGSGPEPQRGRAIIGDPRNDENRIISQLQLALIRFHNLIVDRLSPEYSGAELFEEARKKTTWHYQWVVLHDFMAAVCGEAALARILNGGRKVYCSGSGEPFIPVEFSVAAYRFGHSMIPMSVNIRKGGGSFELFGDVLGRGFQALSDPRAVVDWHELVTTDEKRNVQRAEKLDTKLVSDLLELPTEVAADDRSLAERNMARSNAFRLPAGEAVAQRVGHLCGEDFASLLQIDKVRSKAKDILGTDTGIPLWLYLLAEAEVVGRETKPGHFDKGEGLGPVGARLVGEVLIGLMELDEESFLGSNRNFEPYPEFSTLGGILAASQAAGPGLPSV